MGDKLRELRSSIAQHAHRTAGPRQHWENTGWNHHPQEQRGSQTPDQSRPRAGRAMREEQAKSKPEKTPKQHGIRKRGRQQCAPQSTAHRTQTQSQQRLNPNKAGDARSRLRSNGRLRCCHDKYSYQGLLPKDLYLRSMVWTISRGKKSSTVQSISTRIFRYTHGSFDKKSQRHISQSSNPAKHMSSIRAKGR